MNLRHAFAAMLLIPALAVAQDVVAPTAATPPPASFADLLRYFLFLLVPTVVAVVGKLVAQALESRAAAKGSNWATANAKVTALLADAVAYVDAQTKAERIRIMADGRVTADEARELQAHALMAAKQFLGENGIRMVTDVMGIAAPMVDDFLKGRLQGIFAAFNAAKQGPAPAPTPAPEPVAPAEPTAPAAVPVPG